MGKSGGPTLNEGDDDEDDEDDEEDEDEGDDEDGDDDDTINHQITRLAFTCTSR